MIHGGDPSIAEMAADPTRIMLAFHFVVRDDGDIHYNSSHPALDPGAEAPVMRTLRDAWATLPEALEPGNYGCEFTPSQGFRWFPPLHNKRWEGTPFTGLAVQLFSLTAKLQSQLKLWTTAERVESAILDGLEHRIRSQIGSKTADVKRPEIVICPSEGVMGDKHDGIVRITGFSPSLGEGAETSPNPFYHALTAELNEVVQQHWGMNATRFLKQVMLRVVDDLQTISGLSNREFLLKRLLEG